MKPVSGCPDKQCLATDPSIRSLFDAERVHIPPDILARNGPGDTALVCRHCGFVWFSPPPEPFVQRPGTPAGYVENVRFIPVDVHHPLKRAP
ncbi:hypothetical protein WME75_28270 [Sorangium sp. So ce1014]|uniref:hypothetical protein n=1 Tax=Sorangium sp. So ce1014 TaxID=3133326 RepID=UPI003F6414FE